MKLWKPKIGDYYYYIKDCMYVYKTRYTNDAYDKLLLRNCNYFKFNKEARWALKQTKEFLRST